MRTAPKAPLAVAGILVMPLFFVGLMAMSLAVEKPTVVHAVKKGKTIATFGDPSGSVEAKIWLLALLPCLVVVVVGTFSVLLGRLGIVTTATAAIAITVALLIPIGTWATDHANRYPVGVDLTPRSAGSEDIYLKGEWEASAKKTARQLGTAAISIAGIAILLTGLFEVRRRRGGAPAPPPPPLELATGGAPPVSV